jgi:hypothetical protein
MAVNVEMMDRMAEQNPPNKKTLKQKLRSVLRMLFPCVVSKQRDTLTIVSLKPRIQRELLIGWRASHSTLDEKTQTFLVCLSHSK